MYISRLCLSSVGSFTRCLRPSGDVGESTAAAPSPAINARCSMCGRVPPGYSSPGWTRAEPEMRGSAEDGAEWLAGRGA